MSVCGNNLYLALVKFAAEKRRGVFVELLIMR